MASSLDLPCGFWWTARHSTSIVLIPRIRGKTPIYPPTRANYICNLHACIPYTHTDTRQIHCTRNSKRWLNEHGTIQTRQPFKLATKHAADAQVVRFPFATSSKTTYIYIYDTAARWRCRLQAGDTFALLHAPHHWGRRSNTRAPARQHIFRIKPVELQINVSSDNITQNFVWKTWRPINEGTPGRPAKCTKKYH